jgi:hypothetical protein
MILLIKATFIYVICILSEGIMSTQVQLPWVLRLLLFDIAVSFYSTLRPTSTISLHKKAANQWMTMPSKAHSLSPLEHWEHGGWLIGSCECQCCIALHRKRSPHSGFYKISKESQFWN